MTRDYPETVAVGVDVTTASPLNRILPHSPFLCGAEPAVTSRDGPDFRCQRCGTRKPWRWDGEWVLCCRACFTSEVTP